MSPPRMITLSSLLVLLTSCLELSQTGVTAENVLSVLEGTSVTLPCVAPSNSHPVLWIPPHDALPLRADTSIILNNRMKIQVNKTQGQHNITLKFTLFPRDNGTWICKTSTGIMSSVSLQVIVAPSVFVPQVHPRNVSLMVTRTEAWTFTCIAQHAYPPVKLTWIRTHGPDVTFDVTPPSMTSSSAGTVSVSVKLIVSPLHLGSRFSCQAQHPSFSGKGFSNHLFFYPPQARLAALQHAPDARHQMQQTQSRNKKLEPVDKALAAVIILLLLGILLACAAFCKFRRNWNLDVRTRSDYTPLPSSQAENSQQNGKSNKSDATNILERTRRGCIIKSVIASFLCVVLLSCLCLAIPVYLKGILPPNTGTDEMWAVTAGSALWLDCSRLAQPISSVLQITWSHNQEKFFKQYFINRRSINHPTNDSLGMRLGSRTRSHYLGQISIWPLIPGEGGLYMCEVAVMQHNSGQTAIRRKTMAVYAMTGPIINYVLLSLLSISVVCCGLLLITGCHYSLRCQCVRRGRKRQKSDTSWAL